MPADALIGGIGKINGGTVVFSVEDFTTLGGSIGHGNNAKRLRLATIALESRLPFVMLLDGAGAVEALLVLCDDCTEIRNRFDSIQWALTQLQAHHKELRDVWERVNHKRVATIRMHA